MDCPKCKSVVPNSSLNIQTDLGKCEKCGEIFKISEVYEEKIDYNFDIKQPPPGAYLIEEKDTYTFGATTRSATAFFLVPFTMVWAGGSLSGIYGNQIISGKLDIFLSLFGIPFLIGSIFLISLTMMMLGGKIEFIMDRQGVRVLTGLGPIGFRKQFNWSEYIQAKKTVEYYNRNLTEIIQVELKGNRILKFGRLLSDERLLYVYNTFLHLSKKYISSW